MILEIWFSEIRTRSELAEKMGVPIRALDLVSPSSTDTCITNNCNLPAVLNNNRRCMLCSQTWFPKCNREGKVKSHRGYGLYGRQFMRIYGEDCKSPPKSCCCENPLCEEIGYSHDGTMCMPFHGGGCKVLRHETLGYEMMVCEEGCPIVAVLGMLGIRSPEKRKKIAENRRDKCIAPWHYHRRHLERGEGGNWKFKELEKYTDDDGEDFDFPPPNADLQKFIDGEVSKLECSRAGYDDDEWLPSWVRKVARIQEGALDSTTNGSADSAGSRANDDAEGAGAECTSVTTSHDKSSVLEQLKRHATSLESCLALTRVKIQQIESAEEPRGNGKSEEDQSPRRKRRKSNTDEDRVDVPQQSKEELIDNWARGRGLD